MPGRLATIWQFRHFWLSLAGLDLRVRYRRSVLGLGWSLLNPIVMTAVFCVAFASWLGNGANAGVSPDQLRNALGSDQVQQMARSAGLPVDQLLAMLAQHLPGTIDKMSPNGALDENAASGTQDDGGQAGGSLGDQAGLGDVGR